MARSVIATDDFEAYSVGSFPSSNWTDLDNSFGQIRVVTGKGVQNAFSDHSTMRRAGGTYSADQYAKIKVKAPTVTQNGRIGATCRNSADTGAGQDCYVIYVFEDDGVFTVAVARINDHTLTTIASTTQTIVDGDTVSLEVTGTGETVTLNGYKNDVLIGALTGLTDTSGSRITAAGLPGVYGFASGATLYGDDWEGGDITVGGGSVVPTLPQRNRRHIGRYM